MSDVEHVLGPSLATLSSSKGLQGMANQPVCWHRSAAIACKQCAVEAGGQGAAASALQARPGVARVFVVVSGTKNKIGGGSVPDAGTWYFIQRCRRTYFSGHAGGGLRGAARHMCRGTEMLQRRLAGSGRRRRRRFRHGCCCVEAIPCRRRVCRSSARTIGSQHTILVDHRDVWYWCW